jgi:hypothetical protein
MQVHAAAAGDVVDLSVYIYVFVCVCVWHWLSSAQAKGRRTAERQLVLGRVHVLAE